MHVLIQEDHFSTCISHQSRNFAAVNQNLLSIMYALLLCEIWCSLVTGMAPHLHFVCLPLVSGLPKHLGFNVQLSL